MGNKFVDFGYDVYVVICDNTNGDIPYYINNEVKIFNIAGTDYTKSLTIWQKCRRAMSGNQNARHIYEESITDMYISSKLSPIIHKSENISTETQYVYIFFAFSAGIAELRRQSAVRDSSYSWELPL